MNAHDGLQKIAFEVNEPGGSGFEIERLWGKHIKDNIYMLDNSPFQARGVSLGDKVFVERVGGDLRFSGVAERGHHSTYRVKLPPGYGHEYFLQYWEALALLGCTFEGADGEQRLYAIDIPNPEHVADVYRVLQQREDDGVWEFEEAHYFDPAQQFP